MTNDFIEGYRGYGLLDRGPFIEAYNKESWVIVRYNNKNKREYLFDVLEGEWLMYVCQASLYFSLKDAVKALSIISSPYVEGVNL
jgi:hypothetical protein